MRISPEKSGDRIGLFDQFGHVVDDFQFTTELPWSKFADGFGHSLVAKPGRYDELAETGGNRADNEEIRWWRYSAFKGGSPWSDDPKPVPAGSRNLPIEISFANFDSNPQWIELFNTQGYTVDVSGWAIVQSIKRSGIDELVFYFPENSIIKPGQFLKFGNDTLGFSIKKGTTLFKAQCCFEGKRYFTGDFVEFIPTTIALDKRAVNENEDD